MLKAMNKAEAECQAGAVLSGSVQPPRPRPAPHRSQSNAGTINARQRKVRFHISNLTAKRTSAFLSVC